VRPRRLGYTLGMDDQRKHTDNDEPVRENPGQDNEQTADPAEGDTAPTARPPEQGSPATGEAE
jgi:hypothetical protein